MFRLHECRNYSTLLAITAGLISLPTAFISAPAYAGLRNGSFETGDFTGWSTTGNTSIKTASFGSQPKQGNFQALVSTTADGRTATPGELEDFLGLEPFSLDNINGPIFSGSALQQEFSAVAGQTLSFNWNFLTNEASQSPNFNGFAFVKINKSTQKLADTFSTLIPSSTFFVSETGYRTFSYTIPTTGNYSLGIGVATVGDAFGGFGILVDNAALVPEPGSVVGLVAIASASLGNTLRRRKKKHYK
ncbi:PEP-CTERM sorting domain-containing protein [Nostoc sp. FACHB-110]|uniref:PEP-CTERM sorting domain-containing protein n=1 Tax=Nostoc sp. FACHB-110 TaxID=2692834 RepID=UPI0016873C42|nr:PEP-CTERM sorting domain-containing protein [Nostoc sp. FACHB-110]MBD2440585.1 PEP-CTERM sorting domain-containing protein [Nostoc sp. FACHB-110]